VQSNPPRSGHWTDVIVAAVRAGALGQTDNARLQTGAADVVVVAGAELVVVTVLKLVDVADDVVVTGLRGHVGSLMMTLVGPTMPQTVVMEPSRMPACTCCGVMLRPRT